MSYIRPFVHVRKIANTCFVRKSRDTRDPFPVAIVSDYLYATDRVYRRLSPRLANDLTPINHYAKTSCPVWDSH